MLKITRSADRDPHDENALQTRPSRPRSAPHVTDRVIHDRIRNHGTQNSRPARAHAWSWRIRSRSRHRCNYREPLAARLRLRIQLAVGQILDRWWRDSL